jgi:hypothetical protein
LPQGGEGVMHPASFLFSLLGDLNITTDTAPLLQARRTGVVARPAVVERIACIAQSIMEAASEQLAGDAAAAGSKTVRLPSVFSSRYQRADAELHPQAGRASHHRLQGLANALQIAFRCGLGVWRV